MAAALNTRPLPSYTTRARGQAPPVCLFSSILFYHGLISAITIEQGLIKQVLIVTAPSYKSMTSQKCVELARMTQWYMTTQTTKGEFNQRRALVKYGWQPHRISSRGG